MAVGATIAKVAASLAKNKEGRKVLKAVLGILLGIVLLIVGVFFVIASALSQGPLLLLDWVFGGASVPPPEDTQQAITEMQGSFEKLDEALVPINERLGADTVDAQWVKAVFYVLYLEQPQPPAEFYFDFVDCFVTTDDVGEPIPQHNDIALLESLRSVCVITMEDSVLQLAEMVYTQFPSSL